MPLAACTCFCGSTDNLVRNFLKRAGYGEWLTIPIVKGKAESKALLNRLPQFPEVEMLRNYLEEISTWAVVIGYNELGCRWADISKGGPKVTIPAEFLVKEFA